MKWLIGLGIAAAVLIGGFLMVNGINATGVQMEKGLNAQYLDDQNELSQYKQSFYEQTGLANLKSQQMDTILTDAIKGRYDGTKMSPGTGGSMFSAIKEAYPNIDLSTYDRIADFVRAGREAFKNKQSKMLDMLRAYDTWRQENLLRAFFINTFLHFPSNGLEARIGTSKVTGQAALDQMWTIVTTGDTQKAFQTGTEDKTEIPGLKTKP